MTRRVVAMIVGCAALASCVGSTEQTETVPEVTVFGPYRDADAERFVSAMLAPFEAITGVRVRYTGTNDFVADLRERLVDVGRPPSIAIIPQPGFVAELVDDGRLATLPPEVRTAIDSHFAPGVRDMSEYAGASYGLPVRVTVKSLVWYRPDVFADRGWEVPTTLDELSALVDEAVADPDLGPWCMSVGAGGATGWPATDWVEDIVLRRSGEAAYDDWATGDLRFASDPIESAFAELSSLVLAAGHLAGGTAAAVETATTEIFDGLLGGEPTCAMAKQADFARAWLPDGTDVGPDGDVDVFVLPAEDDGPAPIVVGLDTAVMFDDSPEVVELMKFLAEPAVGVEWVQAGGFISPKTSIGVELYPDELTRRLVSTVDDASALVVDASDVMPLDVGTTLYWQTITRWLVGQVDFGELANTLDTAFTAVRLRRSAE